MPKKITSGNSKRFIQLIRNANHQRGHKTGIEKKTIMRGVE